MSERFSIISRGDRSPVSVQGAERTEERKRKEKGKLASLEGKKRDREGGEGSGGALYGPTIFQGGGGAKKEWEMGEGGSGGKGGESGTSSSHRFRPWGEGRMGR